MIHERKTDKLDFIKTLKNLLHEGSSYKNEKSSHRLKENIFKTQV